MTDLAIRAFGRDDVQANIEALGEMMHACVHAGASIGYILPYSREDGIAFWTQKVLPRLDGHELVAAMRADPRFSDVPVVLVSAQASWSDVAEGLTGGADDYLAKPFSLAELRARLATHLGRAMDRITTAEAFEERQAHLQRALEGHRVVGQAIGILVERHRITASQAFDLLRDASQHRNIKMRDIAQRVIETGLDPDQA